MTPIEKNARWLVGVMVKHFPNGATSEDLRRQFEKDTTLVRQSFYNALRLVKERGWFVREGGDRLYHLNGDGSWREPTASIGEQLEKERLEKDRLEYLTNSQDRHIGELQGELEKLRDWTGSDAPGEANVALASLIRIVGSNDASTRQRLKASSAILSYETREGGVTAFVKRFLESLCADANSIPVDYKVEAAELLRRHEAPRVMSETVRPIYRNVEPADPPEDLRALVERQRARMERILAMPFEERCAFAAGVTRNGNGTGQDG
jgi:hypothetical protein